MQEAIALEAVVTAAVIDQRQTQASFNRRGQRLQDVRHDVLGCDEVDVVATDFLQSHHQDRQLACIQVPPFHQLTDLEVLTEDTAQVAAAEEDRAQPIQIVRQGEVLSRLLAEAIKADGAPDQQAVAGQGRGSQAHIVFG